MNAGCDKMSGDVSREVKMRIYLCGSYERRDELRAYRDELQTIGHWVTSRWMNEAYPTDAQLSQFSQDALVEIARDDMADIDDSTHLFHFTEPEGSSRSRGGRHFETGYAISRGVNVGIVGPRENIFYHLPEILHFPSSDVFIRWARENR